MPVIKALQDGENLLQRAIEIMCYAEKHFGDCGDYCLVCFFRLLFRILVSLTTMTYSKI